MASAAATPGSAAGIGPRAQVGRTQERSHECDRSLFGWGRQRRAWAGLETEEMPGRVTAHRSGVCPAPRAPCSTSSDGGVWKTPWSSLHQVLPHSWPGIRQARWSVKTRAEEERRSRRLRADSRRKWTASSRSMLSPKGRPSARTHGPATDQEAGRGHSSPTSCQ